MAAHTESAKKSRTKEQSLHRARFALITHVGGDLYESIYVGYRNEARNLRTTQNGLFVRENIDNVIGDVLSVSINEANLEDRRVSPSDHVYLVAYCPEMRGSKCAFGAEAPAKTDNEGGEQNNGGSNTGSNTGGSNSGQSGTQTGGNTGGNDNSGSTNEETLAAPVISGTSPFDESTEVTITCSTNVRAIAIKDGQSSQAVSRMFSKSTGGND